ncbi:MAG: glycosyltransferase [Verrucomicrobia bacterium]|nr:glycosyltransferase [Verrucomicrobiota bacterium]
MKPIVASFCTYFLKAEMLHIYRQITSLQRVHTFVIAKIRENAALYPFNDLELLKSSNPSPAFRGRLKYLVRAPALVYRGEFEVIRRVLLRRNPDLMHIYFGNTGVHLLPLIERWDRPCVVSFHGMDVQRRKNERDYEAKLRKLLRLVPLVLVRSRSIAQRLIELDCDPQKIRLNRTGIPLEEFPYLARNVPVAGAWTIVQACRLVPKKGLVTALRAFARFVKAFPRSRFLIAGDGPLRRELEQLVRQLGLQNVVVFLGFLGQSQLRALYEKAHIFMHPSELPPDSNEEGIPNSMLEAMASGLPVVATRHGGIPEAVTDGVNGLLVAERDDDGLVNSLFNLVEDPPRWKTLGASASRTVATGFAQPRQTEFLESAYFEAIEQWRKKALT